MLELLRVLLLITSLLGGLLRLLLRASLFTLRTLLVLEHLLMLALLLLWLLRLFLLIARLAVAFFVLEHLVVVALFLLLALLLRLFLDKLRVFCLSIPLGVLHLLL